MKKLLCLLIASMLCGCADDWSRGIEAGPAARTSRVVIGASSVPHEAMATTQTPATRAATGFANAPDRGGLVEYPASNLVRQTGAYTWHAVELSEEHALRAIATGEMRFTSPEGLPIRLKYERHVEHADGNWSWIGRATDSTGQSTVITFGDEAAFGSIPQGRGKPALRLTVADGRAWVVAADPRLLSQIRNEATHPDKLDYFVPPKLASGASTGIPAASGMQSGSTTTPVAATSAAGAVVDVLVGYTPGFAGARGGQSAALTRVHNLVDITNQAYVESQVDAQVRLVHAMQVDYPDATDNGTALEEMTGFRAPSTRITPAPAFSALRAARDQYGADLVTLVRQFKTPENEGCGIAWLIGGGRSGMDQQDQFFGYSVVSDGRDQDTDGKTYFCREETFAHELGHNMGVNHDRDNAKKDDGTQSFGIFDYSFGHKTGAGAGDFFTIMAYSDKRTSAPFQTGYRVFSNPRITICGGFPCGVANQSDNARSLNNTVGIVATFRNTVVAAPPPAPAPLDALGIYAISKAAGPLTGVAGLTRNSNYTQFGPQHTTALGRAGNDGAWAFQLGDFDGDGVRDLYAIKKAGASDKTEVHVLNGATDFSTFLLHRATVLNPTGGDQRWIFRLGDYNRDGKLDLYVIHRAGTDVHVLNGADFFGSFLAHIGTALPATGTDYSWKFELGDYNKDGVLDLYAISKMAGVNRTEVHVLNGATNFNSFLLRTETALPRSGSNNAWEFKLGDYNGDGTLDLYAFQKMHANNTAVHVMNGATNFGNYLANIVTPLPATGFDNAWEFEVARP